MKTITKRWKRAFSGVLAVLLALSFLPATAFAAATDAKIYVMQAYVPEEGKTSAPTVNEQDRAKLHPTHSLKEEMWDTSAAAINLWVYSDDMGEDKTGIVPYYVGQDGQTWYLNKIVWNTLSSIRGAKEVMSAEQIADAASKDTYNFETSNLTGATRNKYYIIYLWSTTKPVGSDEPTPPVDPDPQDPPKYTVTYDLNKPGDTTTVVPILADRTISPNIETGWTIAPKQVKEGTVLPSIPEAEHSGYIAYNNQTDSDVWAFKEWTSGDNTYAPGSEITVTGNMTLKAEWSEVLPDDISAAGMPDLTSTLMSWQNTDVAQVIGNTVDSSRGLQNPWEPPVKLRAVELDADRQVRYRAQFQLMDYTINKVAPESDPCVWFHVEMDRQLRFVDTDVEFQYNSAHWKPLSIVCGENTIPLTVGEDGTFTVQASSLPNEDGVIQPFDVKLGWYAAKTGTDSLLMPATKLVVPEGNPGYQATVKVKFAGYIDTVKYRDPLVLRSKLRLVNNMLQENDWQAYFTSIQKTDPVEQFAYAMWYASLRENELPENENHHINIQTDMTAITTVAQRNYTVVHEYWDGEEQKGQVSDIPVKAYAGDVILATTAAQTTYNGDTYALRNSSEKLEVSKNGKNTLVLYYDLTACNHEWSNWSVTQAPTCTVEGVETRTCTKCHTPETQTIDPLGHDWREAWEQNEDGHWHICDRCGATSEAETHVYPDEWTVRTPATTTAEGEEYRDCTVCGHEVTRPIAQLPVTPVIPPVTPPVTPSIPDTPTPLDPGTNIPDEEVPLANTVGLNNIDHFAYIAGYEDGTVRPTNNITRAEVATIFFRLMTEDYRVANWSTSNTFTDASPSGWYNAAISTAAKAGILKGYADGSVKPNANITRAEFATIAARFISDEITDDGVGDFSDTANHWAAKEIRLAAKAGWIVGDGNRFRPDDPITRAEVMVLVNRMLDRVPDADHMLPGMKTWSDNPEGTWYYAAVQEATNDHDYERAEDGATEIWTALTEAKDWTALEAEWIANNGASAPKAETETQGLPDGI